MSKRRIAVALLTLAGLLWTWHGIALLILGEEAMLGIAATPAAITATASLYLSVAVILVTGAVATVKRRRHALTLGVTAALTFVISGFIANRVLFDTSRLPHDITNVALTATIVWLLLRATPDRRS